MDARDSDDQAVHKATGVLRSSIQSKSHRPLTQGQPSSQRKGASGRWGSCTLVGDSGPHALPIVLSSVRRRPRPQRSL